MASLYTYEFFIYFKGKHMNKATDGESLNVNTTIKVTAPTRLDLIGGTIDLWPINQILDHKGTINVAVDLPATVTCRLGNRGYYKIISLDQDYILEGDFAKLGIKNSRSLPEIALQRLWDLDLGIELSMDARSPKGAGIGGSSCLTLCLVSAILKLKELVTGSSMPDEYTLVRMAQNIEAHLLHTPTGCQDYWGALRGGVNLISYAADQEMVKTLSVKDFPALAGEIVLCYSGKERNSGINNWEIFKRFMDQDPFITEKIRTLGALSEEALGYAKRFDWKSLKEVSFKEWQIRKQLCPEIETIETKILSAVGEQCGASFSRICGAGGGGVMMFFIEKEHQQKLKDALVVEGGQILDAHLVDKGLSIEVMD